MTDKILVHSTCSSKDEAERLARALVESRLAACVAITPGVTSFYRWQGAIEQSEEWSLAIKTSRGLFPALRTELARLHSYQVPEILAVPVLDGSEAYLAWMDAELQAAP
ncbi:MAG: divalent-cation tolerance protein CutA [Acidobacteria bacterium]|nr:divalent-cation tolerance protein CutA [Acidobacteriota bacterium]